MDLYHTSIFNPKLYLTVADYVKTTALGPIECVNYGRVQKSTFLVTKNIWRLVSLLNFSMRKKEIANGRVRQSYQLLVMFSHFSFSRNKFPKLLGIQKISESIIYFFRLNKMRIEQSFINKFM